MIRVRRLADLPGEVPEQARRAVRLAWRAQGAAWAGAVWGEFPASLLMFFQRADEPEMDVAIAELPDGLGVVVAHTEDLLLGMVHRGALREHTAGEYVGVAVFSEAIEQDSDAPELSGSPEEMAAAIEDLVESGRARQYRVVLGVLGSGWRFEVRWDRGQMAPGLAMCAPGERWPAEDDHPLWAPLCAVHARLAVDGAE